MKNITINFTLNGKPVSVETAPNKRLLDLLHDDLGMLSVKEGCSEGECGACTIILDGRAVTSCIIPVMRADGAEITTIEGVAISPTELHPIQEEFINQGAIQCGFCTPGFILEAESFLKPGVIYSDSELRKLLSGHLCRCTGYENILSAVRKTMYDRAGVKVETGSEMTGPVE
jgi:carbon-monoxide dehydrogenase small subunit